MALWPIAGNGRLASGWFNWNSKIDGLYGVLRDRWGPLDVSSLEIAAVIILFALLSPRLALSRALALGAILFAVGFVFLPRFILDSAYADVRLLPYMFALALLAIRLRDPADARLGGALAALSLAFFAMRILTNTLSLAIAAEDQRSKLEALSEIPRGGRVASFYVLPVAQDWALERNAHLGGLVIARREGYSNDQWLTTRHNLLQLKYRTRGGFSANPSELVRPNGSADRAYRTLDQALAQVPRDQFDYVWLINLAPFDGRFAAGLDPVWSGSGSILYRTRRPAAPH
jgi:hypothetical protein